MVGKGLFGQGERLGGGRLQGGPVDVPALHECGRRRWRTRNQAAESEVADLGGDCLEGVVEGEQMFSDWQLSVDFQRVPMRRVDNTVRKEIPFKLLEWNEDEDEEVVMQKQRIQVLFQEFHQMCMRRAQTGGRCCRQDSALWEGGIEIQFRALSVEDLAMSISISPIPLTLPLLQRGVECALPLLSLYLLLCRGGLLS